MIIRAFGATPSDTNNYLSLPLYDLVSFDAWEQEDRTGFIEQLKSGEGPVDSYCISCEQESTFKGYLIRPTTQVQEAEWIDDTIFGVELRCARDAQHRMYVVFHSTSKGLMKIGQVPSIADLNIPGVEKYRKLLGPEKYKELTRAIGLKAHGVGIGAYVYLRRIFERLIESAYNEACRAEDWNDNDYQKARMEEKIDLLGNFLPSFLVENRGIYGVLSKGIHSLSEAECLKHFDVVRIGIELILDEKLERQRKDEKLRQASQALQNLR